MLLPLQGESVVVYSSPRAPLSSALGYEQVALSGRAELHPWPAIIYLSSYHESHEFIECNEAARSVFLTRISRMLSKFASLIAFERFERFVLKKTPRITRMLTKFAVLIAFESFARFVHSTNRIVPSGSLSAKFDRFERFVLKKLVIERPPE